MDANHFDGMDTVTFLNPAILSGTEDIDADWQKGSISLSGTLSALGGLFTVTGQAQGSMDGGIMANETASLNLGQLAKVPGLSLLSSLNLPSISANATLYVAPGFDSSSLAQDYVEVTGSVGKFGTVGLQVFFNGAINVIDKLSLNLFGDPTFQVSTGTSSVLVGAESTVPLQGGGVPLVLADPDGHQTTVDTANPATSGAIQYVPSLSSSSSAVVSIAAPAAGTWSIAVADTTGLGTVSYDGDAVPTLPAPPTVSIPAPPPPPRSRPAACST